MSEYCSKHGYEHLKDECVECLKAENLTMKSDLQFIGKHLMHRDVDNPHMYEAWEIVRKYIN